MKGERKSGSGKIINDGNELSQKWQGERETEWDRVERDLKQ